MTVSGAYGTLGVSASSTVFFLYLNPADVEKSFKEQKGASPLILAEKAAFAREHAEGVLARVRAKVIDPSLSDYIWHREGIRWAVCESPSSSPFAVFIRGSVSFGEGQDDEWFCVRLMLKVTACFPGLVATIFDADGDFVLIEAAEELPEWLEPATSRNRIFIYNGNLHIIDLETMSRPLSLLDALSLIRSAPEKTKASASISRAVTDRACTQQQKHRARVTVPLRIAQLIHEQHALIGPALAAFVERDPEAMRACAKMSLFSPGPNRAGGSFVETTVTFTQLQFAMLACQEFKAPQNDQANFPTPDAKSDLGMKLTCAFEMLAASPDFPEARSAIEMIVAASGLPDAKAVVNNESEDSLDWLHIPDGAFDETMEKLAADMGAMLEGSGDGAETDASPFASRKVRPADEFEAVVEKMKFFLTQDASAFDGIDTNSDSDSDDDSTESKVSLDLVDSEDDEVLLEREIFEAIAYDPELLMKIIEADARAGADGQEFIRRFQAFQESEAARKEPRERDAGLATKGIADIDPERLAEARRPNRRVESQVTEMDASASETASTISSTFEFSDSDLYDEFSIEDQKQSAAYQTESSCSDSEAETTESPRTLETAPSAESESIEAYMAAMDAELAVSGVDRLESAAEDDKAAHSALAKHVAQSLLSAASTAQADQPLLTLYSSLGHRLPRPQ